MIVLENITKIYKQGALEVPALRGISLRVEQGEFIAIMGQSGSGKSTLLQILGLLDKPTAGKHVFLEHDVNQLDDNQLAELRAEEIGFVFQQFYLLARTSALDNVTLPLIYHHRQREGKNPENILKHVGLGDRMRHLPNELSGGQQQRTAIARALVQEPHVLLADEPTGNLDSASGKEIMELFRQLNNQGITVIIVTHEAEVAEYADRIIRIQDGLIFSDETKQKQGKKKKAIAVVEKGEEKKTSEKNIFNKYPQIQLLWTHFCQARRALLANKMRTCLSTLGIIIGVGAVVAMLSIGQGAEQSVKDQMAGLGSNRITIRPERHRVGGVQGGEISRMTLTQVEDVRKNIPNIKAVTPVVRGHAQVVYGNKNADTEINGTTPEYMKIYSAEPAYGRFFTEEEDLMRERVALLGNTVVKTLFGNRDPIGETIKINRISFLVIGILPIKGSGGPRDNDDIVIVPLRTAMKRLMGKNYIDSIDVAASDTAAVPQVQEDIQELTQTWPTLPGVVGEPYRIYNLASVQEAFTAVARTLSMLLAAIAGISLLVGGIGIMNIMLVSVTERTREIGLRKAIGARNMDILSQILIESVVLCLAGGVVGIGLAGVLILIASKFTGWTLSISVPSIILACGFSALIGIIFGLWPARIASLKHPIEALRYE